MLAQVARDDSPTRSANCPPPAQPWFAFQIRIGANPKRRLSVTSSRSQHASTRGDKPGSPGGKDPRTRAMPGMSTSPRPQNADHACHDPGAVCFERTARYAQTADQVQQQTSGVSLVMITPPITSTGIAGSTKTAISAERPPPVVSDDQAKDTPGGQPSQENCRKPDREHQRTRQLDTRRTQQGRGKAYEPGDQRPAGVVTPIKTPRPGPVLRLVGTQIPVTPEHQKGNLSRT